MPKITLQDQNRVLDFEPGTDLLKLLSEKGVIVDNPCNGKGTCGKCKVRILDGNLPEMELAERNLLSVSEIEAGIRLACMVKPHSDLTLETLGQEKAHRILTQGYQPEFEFAPAVHKLVITIEKPTLENQQCFEEAILNSLELENLDWRILKNLSPTFGELTAVFNGRHLIGLEAGDTRHQLYGVAVDIGTTTVVAVLVNMNTGEMLETASMLNPQKKYGLDVLTRISYALENGKEAADHLQYEMVTGLNELVGELCRKTGVAVESIYEMTVAANCTMLHFLLGIDSSSIGRAPYAPAFVGSKNMAASEIGLELAPGARLYCLPSVSAYIGADIVAGAYVCQLHERRDRALFIDIGTNGEIVLSNRGELISCSCAAGPALEGMNISSGMRAAAGAVEKVRLVGGKAELGVIGDGEPSGLCGSGILGAVKELLRAGLVKPDGAFIKKESLEPEDVRHALLKLDGTKRECHLTEGPSPIKITQKDVRQVQLAKGAILSGFYALLKRTELDMEELDAVMIAGQFGAHLPADSLTGVGILPAEVADRLVYVGNSSKTGAYMALMSGVVRQEIEALAGQMAYMELGATEGYERLFSQCLIFPKVTEAL